MKITKSKLKQIIAEEIKNAVEEGVVTGRTNFRKGMRGQMVADIQSKLIDLGYLPAGEDDGAFGGKTKAAVQSFQKSAGLSADGVVGPKTYQKMDKVIAAASTKAFGLGSPKQAVAAMEKWPFIGKDGKERPYKITADNQIVFTDEPKKKTAVAAKPPKTKLQKAMGGSGALPKDKDVDTLMKNLPFE